MSEGWLPSCSRYGPAVARRWGARRGCVGEGEGVRWGERGEGCEGEVVRGRV